MILENKEKSGRRQSEIKKEREDSVNGIPMYETERKEGIRRVERKK